MKQIERKAAAQSLFHKISKEEQDQERTRIRQATSAITLEVLRGSNASEDKCGSIVV